MKTRLLPALAFCLMPFLNVSRAADQAIAADLVLKGGTVIDGTGAPGLRADVALKGDAIVAVGAFAIDPIAKVIDASSLVVAPGFIDLHNHSDSSILGEVTRANLNYTTQGVTTIVTGNCGSGALDVAKYLATIDRQGAGTNVIHLIPHGTLRESILGSRDVRPNAKQLDAMRRLVEKGMKDGAWGISTGLIYLPGRYARTEELIDLSRVVAKEGGLYASHIRNEGAGLLRSIDEVIEIGVGARIPVHVSHLKASGKKNWGLSTAACERILKAKADGVTIHADQYPYVASSTRLSAMVVPHWARQGNAEEFSRLADAPQTAKKLRDEILSELEDRGGGASIRIARYAPKPSRVGLDLAEIARREGTTPLEIVLDVERHGGAQAISFGMSEDDVRRIMKHDFVATASDGSAHRPGTGDHPHPRAYGTFPRKLRYALDEKIISLEQAVHSSSGLPAKILRLPDRGVIRPGAKADIVVFDPKSFRDAADFDHPTRYATGVRHLLVNGQAVIAEGKPTKRLPGRSLRLNRDGPAELILKTGRIWTGDPDRPWAEAIASRGGKIVAVGSRTEIDGYRGTTTKVLDFPGGFASPGLIDAHGHVESLGASLEEVDLRGVSSLDEVARRVRVRLESTPGDEWILGSSWDQSLWPGGEFPTAAILDKVAPNRPVWLRRVDGHAGWANSEALRRAGVDKSAVSPSDGQIVRDKQGVPTGVFVDGAMGLVSKRIPAASIKTIERRILAAQRVILKGGLTSVHDAGLSSKEIEAYRRLDHAGSLKLRVYGMAGPPSGGEVAFVSRKPAPPRPGGRFELRAIKLFIDGAMGSRGGLLFEPYSDDPGNVGLLLIDPKTLEETTAAALKHGWQVCTHAIGDKGNALVLDAYESALKRVPEAKDARLRIEHAQAVRRSDVGRFRTLGVIASMQPSHASDDLRWADARLGPERVKGAYAWRWFLDENVRLAFGSDFPVEVVNPFWGVYASLTRRDEKEMPARGWHSEHVLSVEETLRGFTAGAAFAAFDEARLGVLRPGMLADVTVWDRDPFTVKPIETLRTKVLAAVIEGQAATGE